MTLSHVEPPPLPAPDPKNHGPSIDGAETVDAIVRGSLPDRANPVFVKEIRQAQRGKVFAITLIITIVLAMFGASIASIEILDGDSRQPGVDFFSAIYALLAIAVLVVVPFQAFVSMGSEWDGDTYEMLLLSNLRPLQIVSGKVLAAALQGLMFGLAFLPFIVTAFLLRGVDFGVLVLVLGLTALASVCLSVGTVMLSTLVRTGFIRVVAMVALAGALFSLVPASTTAARGLLTRPEIFAGPQFLLGLSYFVLFVLLMTSLAGCIACNTLAHEEENRSTNVRVVLTATTLTFIGILVHGVTRSGTFTIHQEVVLGTSMAACFILSFFCMFLCLERDRLGLRVAQRVPRSRLTALLVSPWLPGGGRGVAYLWLHIGIIVAAGLILGALAPVPFYMSSASRSLYDTGVVGLILAALYALLYAMTPTVLFGRRPRAKIAQRNAARVGGMIFPMVLLFVPAIAGILFGFRDWQQMRHLGNPIHVMGDAMNRGGNMDLGPASLLTVIVIVLFFLVFYRVIDGIGEAGRASRARPAAASEANP